MIKLNTSLMNQPLDYQCSFRMNSLIEYYVITKGWYTKTQMFKLMLTPARLNEKESLNEFETHIFNLYTTFGESCYFEIFNIIFNKELKKVG